MTKKSLFGNRAVYVAIMDMRMDMVVTRAAYRRPQDNLPGYNIKTSTHTNNYTAHTRKFLLFISYKHDINGTD